LKKGDNIINIYKVLIFDGYNSRAVLVNGFDLVGAIQNNGHCIIQNQIIRAELVGSENQEDYTNAI
jgi:hypothetical protein